MLPALLDFRDPRDVFGLVKASLAIAGFSPEAAAWAKGATLREMLREFGGGIDLSTLAGIPKGSGLGTSSIVGAVIVAVFIFLRHVENIRRLRAGTEPEFRLPR